MGGRRLPMGREALLFTRNRSREPMCEAVMQPSTCNLMEPNFTFLFIKFAIHCTALLQLR